MINHRSSHCGVGFPSPRRPRYPKLRGALSLCAALLCACDDAPGPDSVQPQVTAVDKRAEVTADTSLQSIDGTYGEGCSKQSGAWSLGFGAPDQETLTNPPLEVVPGESGCVLSITAARTVDGRIWPTMTPVVLDPSLQAVGIAFGEPPVVYAGVKLDSWDLNGGYRVAITYSEQPESVIVDETPNTLVSYSATPDSVAVPAPDYDADLTRISIETDLDNVVLSVSGELVLTRRGVQATGYAIATGSLSGYDALDAAFRQDNAAVTATIPGSALRLAGTNLSTPQVRSLILANSVGGVRSYQALTLSFNPQARR
ncbi:MAG: hypothetical protein JWN48_5379 [Myxococcaceae bacterium]|nr:hypothetical protein [Myxococcaceae bacterium]